MKKHTPYLHYIMIISVVLSLSCIKQGGSAVLQNQKVGVMTFNVENLFDTVHDDGKLDYTFLPLDVKKKSKEQKEYCDTLKNFKWRDECKYLDWSETALTMKMKNLAATILQVNNGKGPDVLILQEVENKKVLEQLIHDHLKDAKYASVYLQEGKDIRGIDVAVVTRLPLSGEVVLHEIPFQQISSEEMKDTRGILEVPLMLPGGETLIVYANHFPAPFHKREYRIQAYTYLGELMKKKGDKAFQVAGGDFNTPGDEDRKHNLLGEYVQNNWVVAHKEAYKGNEGSSYYPKDKTWSFLDMILVSKSLNDKKGWDWNPSSFVVANQAKGQLDEDGFPQGFDTRTGVGMSDHLPLYLEIEKKN
jgi:endonuclease/exonuclease/phosphatase family metal-dependent hydrolase